jgi:hypothetical protein
MFWASCRAAKNNRNNTIRGTYNGNKGCSGYALSKTALNMMAQLYVHEFPDTSIAVFAPELVYTQRQDIIRDTVDSSRYLSTQALKAIRSL